MIISRPVAFSGSGAGIEFHKLRYRDENVALGFEYLGHALERFYGIEVQIVEQDYASVAQILGIDHVIYYGLYILSICSALLLPV